MKIRKFIIYFLNAAGIVDICTYHGRNEVTARFYARFILNIKHSSILKIEAA